MKVREFKKKIKNIREEFGDDLTKLDKKLDDLRNKEVKTVLFDTYLTEINNEKNNIQTLNRFFQKI